MVLGHFNGLMVINTKEIGKRQNKWTKSGKSVTLPFHNRNTIDGKKSEQHRTS